MRLFEDHRLPKPVIFVLLMAASFVTMMLPTGTLTQVRNVTLPVALPQWLMQTSAFEVRQAAANLVSRPIPADQHQRLISERDALLNEVASLRYQTSQLHATVAELANVRKQGFPAHGTLIPARVLAMDASPGRDTVVVSKGNVQKVEKNDWVVSSLTVGAGASEGVEEQAHVLGRQFLIGWIDQVAPLTSRVILLSDKPAGKSRPRKVLISPADPTSRPAEGEPDVFILEPLGNERMIIRDIPRRMVESQQVQVGDMVTSTPDDTRLPVAMVIGPIEQLHPNRDKPICFDAIVRHMIEPAGLSQVMIVDLMQPEPSPSDPR